jgi:hypothetical protein
MAPAEKAGTHVDSTVPMGERHGQATGNINTAL